MYHLSLSLSLSLQLSERPRRSSQYNNLSANDFSRLHRNGCVWLRCGKCHAAPYSHITAGRNEREREREPEKQKRRSFLNRLACNPFLSEVAGKQWKISCQFSAAPRTAVLRAGCGGGMAREIIVFSKVLKAGAIFAGGVERKGGSKKGRKKGLIKWSQTVWHSQTFRRQGGGKIKFAWRFTITAQVLAYYRSPKSGGSGL